MYDKKENKLILPFSVFTIGKYKTGIEHNFFFFFLRNIKTYQIILSHLT